MSNKILLAGTSECTAKKFRSNCKNFVVQDEMVELPRLAQKRTRTFDTSKLIINGVELEGRATLHTLGIDYPASYFDGLTCERVPMITGILKPGGDGTKKLMKWLQAWKPPIKKRNKRLTKKLAGRV